jgi:two-component system alkaline phosphatase synthesis response regulator PhoP
MAHLVIAEDSPHMLRLLEMTLRKAGHTWKACAAGDTALAAVQTENPNAALLDITMPEMDGLEVLAALKADPATASIPVIMLTARGQTLTRQQAEESGAAAFLTKPYSPTELLATITKLTS